MKCTTHSLPHCQNRQFTLFYYELHVKCLPSCLMANHCLLWHRSKCFRIACGVESPCLWIPKILFVYPSILSVFIMYYMPNPFPECLCSHHTLSCCFKTYCLPILSCTIIIVNEELSYFPLFTIWSVQSTCGITWVKVSVKKFNFYNQSHYGILVFYQTPECLITALWLWTWTSKTWVCVILPWVPQVVSKGQGKVNQSENVSFWSAGQIANQGTNKIMWF